MASEGKYMAYVGSYSYNGKAKGITVYDVDVEKGTFKERCEVEVDNSSYVIASSDGKTLYSIADEGVVSFRILQNGSLARLNSAPIRGMRGCHLCTDMEDKYVFVSGYHDGKTTVLSLNKWGRLWTRCSTRDTAAWLSATSAHMLPVPEGCPTAGMFCRWTTERTR